MNQTTRMTADLALRLERAFPDKPASYWLDLQTRFDLWGQKHHIFGALMRIEPLRFVEQDGQRFLVWIEGPRKRWLVPGYDHAVPDDRHPPKPERRGH